MRFVASLTLAAAATAVASAGIIAMHDLVALQQLNMPATDIFPNSKDAQLADATSRGDEKRAKETIEAGADTNAHGSRAMTPLLWAMGKRNLSGFKFLLEHGANANAMTCCDEKAAGMVQTLSAMGLAARIESPDYLVALLEHEGDANAVTNKLDETPIFSTITDNRIENAKILIAKGADLNRQDNMSRLTPMAQAVSGTGYEMALLMLRSGADPTKKNRWGKSVVDQIKTRGNRGPFLREADVAAYDAFVSELKKRSLLDVEPPKFPTHVYKP